MWEINSISEQNALSKFSVAICTYGSEFLVTRKHEVCQELTYFLSCPSIWSNNFRYNQMRCTSVSYISIAVWNKLSQGESTLRPFRSLVYHFDLIYRKLSAWYLKNRRAPSWSLLTGEISIRLLGFPGQMKQQARSPKVKWRNWRTPGWQMKFYHTHAFSCPMCTASLFLPFVYSQLYLQFIYFFPFEQPVYFCPLFTVRLLLSV